MATSMGFLKPVVALGEVVGRHRYLAVVWTLLAILGFLGIRRLRQPGHLTSTINAVALSPADPADGPSRLV